MVGWRENVVPFDSVFNQSSATWSWGSPDVLPMFAKGHPHIHTEMYPPFVEDFASKDASKLDTWVLERVRKFFAEAKHRDEHGDKGEGDDQNGVDEQVASLSEGKNKAQRAKEILNGSGKAPKRDFTNLGKPGNVFFLHLLGTDTLGHGHRPTSPDYLRNVRHVDSIVEEVEKLFKNYFKDDATAFVFTSDHGMDANGAHGDGKQENTETPLIAWGAGVRRSMTRAAGESYRPSYGAFNRGGRWRGTKSKTYGPRLARLRRTDVSQADVASLMSTLAGIPIPCHAVGVLPLDYLNLDDGRPVEAALYQARQLFAQYDRKTQIFESRMFVFSRFRQDEEIRANIKLATQMLEQARHEDALHMAGKIVGQAKEGMVWLDEYHRQTLMVWVPLGYLGYMAAIAIHVYDNYWGEGTPDSAASANKAPVPLMQQMCLNLVVLGLLVCTGIYGWTQYVPPRSWLYIWSPVLLWGHVVSNLWVRHVVRPSRMDDPHKKRDSIDMPRPVDRPDEAEDLLANIHPSQRAPWHRVGGGLRDSLGHGTTLHSHAHHAESDATPSPLPCSCASNVVLTP